MQNNQDQEKSEKTKVKQIGSILSEKENLSTMIGDEDIKSSEKLSSPEIQNELKSNENEDK